MPRPVSKMPCSGPQVGTPCPPPTSPAALPPSLLFLDHHSLRAFKELSPFPGNSHGGHHHPFKPLLKAHSPPAVPRGPSRLCFKAPAKFPNLIPVRGSSSAQPAARGKKAAHCAPGSTWWHLCTCRFRTPAGSTGWLRTCLWILRLVFIWLLSRARRGG